MKLFNLHTDGMIWKYTLDLYKLRICFKPVKLGKKYVVWSWG